MLLPKVLETAISLFVYREKVKLLGLVCVSVLVAMIETSTILAIFSYIRIVIDPAVISQNTYLNQISTTLAFSSNFHFLIFMGGLIFLMIVFRMIVTVINLYLQGKFTANLATRLSKQCFENFLNLPYRELLNVNSSELSKYLMVDINKTAFTVLCGLEFVTHSLIAISILGLIIYSDPRLFMMIMVVFGITASLITCISNSKLHMIGKSIELSDRHAFQRTTESLAAIKDIKIYNATDYFSKKFVAIFYYRALLGVREKIYITLPGLLMNTFGFAFLIVVLIYLLSASGNLLSVLPTIGLLVISIQRIIPTLQTAYNTWASMKSKWASVEVIKKSLDSSKSKEKSEAASSDLIKFDEKLSFKKINYHYAEAEAPSIFDVNFTIKKNSTFGVVGISGAGKSTLIDIIAGLLDDYEGEIYCDDTKITASNRAQFNKKIAYVAQQTFLLDASIKENVAFGVEKKEIDELKLMRTLKQVHLLDLIHTLPEGVDTKIGEKGERISGGQRQRIGIARALYTDAEIIIMDEATSALDEDTERKINEMLATQLKDKTIIIISHRLSTVKMCDALLLLENGRCVAQGDCQELMESSDTFKKVYNLV